MTRAYVVLVIAIVVAALSLGVFARLPRPGKPERDRTAPVPEVAIELTVNDRTISPARQRVPKGWRVRLSISSHAEHPARVALAGYEDRVSVTLGPGASWHGAFVADLPGEDFAWLVEGEPVGRLAVTGSHLEEGHR